MSEQEATRAANHTELARDSERGWRLGFWSLIVTQFQGAFSDNALKWLVSFLLLGMSLPQEKRDLLFVLVVPLLFATPFLLFSMTGSFLADRFSKRSVTAGLKIMEIGVLFVALAGLAAANLWIATAALFLLGTQAALFGSSKYGLLPELLPEKRLSWGNGILELGTFLASIASTMAGGLLASLFKGRQGWSGIFFIGLVSLDLTIRNCTRSQQTGDFRKRQNAFSGL